MLDDLYPPDVQIVRLVTAWLSGVLAGEIFVVVAIGSVREVKAAITTTDWVVAIALTLLSIAILAVVIRDEVQSD